jgi:alpha-1,3-rhamnosyl/mannosyltransferase
MRVLIDATPLLVRSAGVKNYLFHWIEHLRRSARGESIGTLPHMNGAPLRHDSSMAGRFRTFRSLAMLALSNHARLPVLDLASRGADIFHSSVLVHRPPARSRLTATIHDLTCYIMPELHPFSNRRAEEGFARVMRRANGLIAVSESTRNDAVRVLGIPPEKITVIHSGVSDRFFECAPEDVDAVRRHYRLGREFILFIGTVEPRKNLDLLLDAYESLPVGLREHYEMVVAGPMGWADTRTIDRLNHVRYLGYIPEKHIAPLTAAATVFAYPSLYEGFGFPVVQAMAAGTPVITSNISSLPEVCADAAILIDPRSQSELRAAMVRLLTSAGLRATMSAAGRERARFFSWKDCAAKSIVFFERIAG